MSFILDTNVVSEWRARRPDARVEAWLASVQEAELFLSVVSVAEVWRGVALLPAGRRRTSMERWIERDLRSRFETRIIDIDPAIAERWGLLMAESYRTGVNMATLDAFIAATALAKSLTLVTRNTRDFLWCDVPVVNPWLA